MKTKFTTLVLQLFICLIFSNYTIYGQDNTLTLDGTEDYVDCGDIDAIDGLTHGTFEVWLKPSDLTTSRRILMKRNGSLNWWQYQFNSATQVEFRFKDAGSVFGSLFNNTFSTGTWYHLALVFDMDNTTNDDKIKLYVNGTEVTNKTIPAGLPSSFSANNGHSLLLGYTNASTFAGEMEEVRLWNDALNADEVTAIYNKTITDPTLVNSCLVAYYKMNESSGTNLSDATGNSNDGTLTNMTGTEWTASTNSITTQNYNDCSELFCLEPSSMAASNITNTSADLAWTENGTATTWNLEWKAGINFTPGTGNEDGSATVNSTPSHSLSGLTSGTVYYVYYYSSCSFAPSQWVGPYAFSTTSSNVAANTFILDGTEDYVDCGDIEAIDGLTHGTFEVWLKPSDLTTTRQIMTKRTGTGIDNYWQYQFKSATQVEFTFRDVGSTFVSTFDHTFSTGTWYHLALVFDMDNTIQDDKMKLYVNGTEVTNKTIPSSLPSSFSANNTHPLRLGYTNASTFAGEMEEVRLWTQKLTAAEVALIYNKTITNPTLLNSCLEVYYKMDESIGTNLPDESGNMNDGTLMNMTGTEWIISNNSITAQNYNDCNEVFCFEPSNMSASNITPSSADLSWTENGTATTWNLEWKEGINFTPGTGNEDGSATVNSTPSHSLSGLTSGTVYHVYYRSNCGSTQSDWTGPYSFFTTSGNMNGNTLTLDGTDDHVNCGDIDAIDGLTHGTFEVWLKPSDLTTGRRILMKRNGSLNWWQYQFNSATQVEFRFKDAGSVFGSLFNHTFSTGIWYHLVLVFDMDNTTNNDKIKLYVNGTEVTNKTIPAGLPSSFSANNGHSLLLGYTNASTFAGEMEEVRLWSQELTAAEVALIYNKTIDNPIPLNSCLEVYYKMDESTGTNLPDESGNGNNGTLTNMSGIEWTISNNSLTSEDYNDCTTLGQPVIFPVELTYFRGQSLTDKTLLTWQTASEINNEGFEIERSTDGKSWKNIGFVNGRGTTYELSNYEFTDNTPRKGINYYRLKQLDYDGAFEYSKVVSVDLPDFQNLEDLKIAPNPIQNNQFTLYLPEIEMEQATLEIFNTVGQLVQTEVLTDSETVIRTDNLPTGMYWFSVNVNGKQAIQKVVVE